MSALERHAGDQREHPITGTAEEPGLNARLTQRVSWRRASGRGAHSSQIESARDTALARARETDNPALADMFSKVADEMSAEVADRLLTELTDAVLEESREQTRQAKALLTQMTS